MRSLCPKLTPTVVHFVHLRSPSFTFVVVEQCWWMDWTGVPVVQELRRARLRRQPLRSRAGHLRWVRSTLGIHLPTPLSTYDPPHRPRRPRRRHTTNPQPATSLPRYLAAPPLTSPPFQPAILQALPTRTRRAPRSEALHGSTASRTRTPWRALQWRARARRARAAAG